MSSNVFIYLFIVPESTHKNTKKIIIQTKPWYSLDRKLGHNAIPNALVKKQKLQHPCRGLNQGRPAHIKSPYSLNCAGTHSAFNFSQ